MIEHQRDRNLGSKGPRGTRPAARGCGYTHFSVWGPQEVVDRVTLGGIKGNVLLLPIKLGSKVPLLVWAHGTNNAVDPSSINELSSGVSTAILRIISAARRK